MTQLALDLEPVRANPNAALLNADGSPKRLLGGGGLQIMPWNRMCFQVAAVATDLAESLTSEEALLALQMGDDL